MDSIVGKVVRPFAAVWRVVALTLVICATGGAWAATPVAEWGPGNFPVSAAGSYDNMTATSGDYTISKNNGYNISTANYIQVAPSSVGGGWPVVISSTDLSALTVVVAFSLDEDASGSLVGLTTGRGVNRFYAYLEDGAMYAGYNNGNSNKYGDLSTTVPTDGTIHYLVFAYGKTAGTQMFYDGVSKYNASGLKEGDLGVNSGNTSEITFGAQRGPQQIINGAKFHYVAIYDSKLGDADAYSAYQSAVVAVTGMVPATPSVDGNNDCTFTITEDSYYDASSAGTYNSITFDVATGKKLVLSGSTLTGTNGITVTGDGVIEVSSATALSGALSGDGTIAYVGVSPSGLTYSASWTGTIWIKNVTGNAHRNFNDWGREGSKVKVSGVSGYLNAPITYTPEVVLDDDTYGFALKVQNGNSPQNNDSNKNRCAIFKKLSGSGTLTAGGDSYPAWPVVKLYDISGFTGNIDCGSSGTGLIALICNEDEDLGDTLFNLFSSKTRCIYISAGRTDANAVSIPSGATWSANSGIYVVSGGTLNLAGGTLCNTLYGSATVTAASTASSLTVANGSHLTVNAALSGSVTVENGGTVDVASASTAGFTVQSGGTLSTAAEISGAIDLTGTMNVYATGTLQFSSGSSIIQQDGVLNVVAGIAHMNVADQGIKGTINIQNGATFKSWGNDRLNYSASAAGGIVNVRQGGTLDMDNTRWTMCKHNQINLYENATVTGTGDINGASIDMNVGSGGDDVTIHALGNATINAPVKSAAHNYGVFNVDEGKTLTFSGRLFTNKTTKKGLGTLKLTYANGNTGATTGAEGDTYTVPTLSEGTIEFAGEGDWSLAIGESRDLSGYAYSGSGSIAVTATQTASECALGSDIVFENVASASLVPTVTLRDGGTVAPVLDGTTATSSGSGTVSISGGATDLDLTCTNTINFGYASFTGASTWRDYTPVYTEDGVYARAGVYTSGTVGTFLANNSAALTLSVVGQMSPTDNTIFLSLGTSSGGSGSGLVIARTSTTDEVTIGYNDGSTVHKITNMTVPNCATSRHSYIITKQDGESTTTFTVYLDGIKWKTLTIAKLTLTGGGFQIGADFGGGIRGVAQSDYDGAAFITIPNSEDETGVLNVMRVYGRVITPAEIAQYATIYPYVSPNGSSTRMFTTSAENWIDRTEASEVWMNSTGGNSGTPTVGANVTVVAQTDTVITVNLESATEYEGLTVNEKSAKFVPASASSGAIKVTGMTVIGSVVTNVYGAVDMTGGPMTITEDGSICFDMSGFDASAIYTATDIDLTSDVDEDATKVSMIAPATPYRTYSLVYESGHYAMRVTPDHEAGSEVYYTGGYWSSAESSFAVVDSSSVSTAVFPGDTVVIDDSHATGGQASSCYFDTALPANVTAIKVNKNYTFEPGVDTAILDGVTIEVSENCTLTFAQTYHTLTLGSITLKGEGTVVFPILPTTLAFVDWTGTVAIPAVTSGESGLNLNTYGVAGSTVRVAGVSSGAWLVDATVAPTVELGGDMTLTAFSATFANTFNKMTGSRAFSLTADGSTEGYQDGYFLIKDVSDFTGSITVDAPGLALGGTSKPSSTAWYGKIVVQVPVTVGSGATWSADGVVLADTSATLTVPDGATVPAVSCGVAGYEVKTDTTTTPGSTIYSLRKRGTIFSVY